MCGQRLMRNCQGLRIINADGTICYPCVGGSMLASLLNILVQDIAKTIVILQTLQFMLQVAVRQLPKVWL